MIFSNLCQIEIAGRLATMYLAGHVRAAERETLVQACGALPPAVQVLCVSLDDLDQLANGALVVIHDLRRNWQSTRRGSFRLAFARGHSGRPVSGVVMLAS